eukprot:1898008-Rhodomonas_salina.1
MYGNRALGYPAERPFTRRYLGVLKTARLQAFGPPHPAPAGAGAAGAGVCAAARDGRGQLPLARRPHRRPDELPQDDLLHAQPAPVLPLAAQRSCVCLASSHLHARTDMLAMLHACCPSPITQLTTVFLSSFPTPHLRRIHPTSSVS